jgi:hypothetical protein
MAEEHNHEVHMHRGGTPGHHESTEHKEKANAMYWSLGIAAAGLVVAVVFLSGNKKSSSNQPQYELVHGSTDFIPNPTDVSIGSNASPLFWPGLPTSGTPHKPKTHPRKKGHNEGKHKDDSHKKKKYGKSPRGASHGHQVSTHNHHNPKTTEKVTVHHGSQHTKGKANG